MQARIYVMVTVFQSVFQCKPHLVAFLTQSGRTGKKFMYLCISTPKVEDQYVLRAGGVTSASVSHRVEDLLARDKDKISNTQINEQK